MRILVTGGAGFIGSHLVDKLVEKEHEVIVVDDYSGGYIENLNPDATIRYADCRNEKEIDEIFSLYKPEIVYHLAANAAENKAQFSPVDITSRNYDASIKVLKAFIKNGGKRFVYTSSIAVYGAIQTPFYEIDKPEPEDLYGITKYAFEQTLKVMSRVHGFEYVIARPHNVYGPRQNMTDPYRNVVTIFMNHAMKQEPYPIYGDGEQVRCFSYIDDVVQALCECGFVDVSGMTFNIGADEGYTVNNLVEAIAEVTGWSRTSFLPERPQEVKQAIADHTLAKAYLGYQDKTGLKEGILKTWEWAKAKGPQKQKYTAIEIPSPKIPSNWL